MTATTKGPTVEAEPFSTRCANTSQQFQPSSKEQNVNNSSNQPFQPVEGQKVRILVGRHTGKLGTVTTVDAGNVWVRPDGAATPAPYVPEELDPARTDDTVPATDEEVVTYLTGSRYVDPEDGVEGHGFSEYDPHTCSMAEPHDGDHVCEVCDETWGGVDEFRCPAEGCDTVLYATGRVADGEQDEYLESVREHRLSHEPVGALTGEPGHDDPRDAVRGTVAEVSVAEVWLALREIPELFDLLARVADLPRPAVARSLRAVANVVDPEAGR